MFPVGDWNGPVDARHVAVLCNWAFIRAPPEGVDHRLPETIREQLGIGEQMRILCGLAIGYTDPDFPGNSLRVLRNPLEDNVVFVES
jgi:hypothetical protein